MGVLGELKADYATLVPGQPAKADGCLEKRIERCVVGRLILHALL